MSLLAARYAQGRRFVVVDGEEHGDRVIVGMRLSDPGWEGTVDVYKMFTFDGATVVQIQDCRGRDDALTRVAAT